MAAALSGKEKLVDFLSSDAKLLQAIDNQQRIALHWAANSLEVITLLLNKGLDINARDKNLRTALMNAVVLNRKDNVKTLLELDADKDLKDEDGKTAKEWALKKNFKDIEELLKQ